MFRILENTQLMTKIGNKSSKEFKIKRYHSDEIRLMLFICATDLTDYNRDDLIIFTECIEGRIEVLWTTEYLNSIHEFIYVGNLAMKKFLELKTILQGQYSSQWHKKMTSSSWTDIIKLSHEILGLLKLEYQEPISFMDNNLEVDWT